MTLTKQSAENTFIGDGATTAFSTNIYGISDADFVVLLRTIATGAEELLTLDTDYTISRLEEASGVTVTYPVSGSALPATKKIVIRRNIDYTQSLALSNVSNFLPEVLEEELDKIVMMVQQINAAAGRSLKLAVGSGNIGEFPEAVANTRLGFDANADPALLVGSGSAEISSVMEQVVSAASLAAGRSELGVEIGVDVQAYADLLDDIAGLTPTDGVFIVGDGTDFVAESGATVRASLGLTIGTNVQAYNGLLANIAGITFSAGDLLYYNGTNLVNLGAGTEGQVLTQGASNAPEWGVENQVKAWVNFNGTGTVAIRESFNVSSITDNGTGDYTVNFTTALVDANYSCVADASAEGTTDGRHANPRSFSTTSINITTKTGGGEFLADVANITAAIFR